jgi:hypothetical protein
LYQWIEQKQWKRIVQRFEEEEEEDDDDDDDDDDGENECDDVRDEDVHETGASQQRQSGKRSLSIRQQAVMWVVRKELNGRLKWRILPLHAAIIFRAPHQVIDVIVQCHPIAARQKDDQGMIPLHLAMKNFNLQYHHPYPPHRTLLSHPRSESTSQHWPSQQQHHNHQQHQPHQQQLGQQPLVETMTTLWRTVEELLTAYPSGIFSRDRKGRTPLQLGIQTVQKNFNTKSSGSINNNSSCGIHHPAIQQQQEMMLAALSVLERYETIYRTAQGDRDTATSTMTTTEAVAQQSPPLSPPQSPPQQSSGIPGHPAPKLNDTGLEYVNGQRNLHSTNNTILSIQQQHLKTLQTLRTMFLKQRQREQALHEQQQATLQQQLDDSISRERQLQIELDTIRRHLQETQQQQQQEEQQNSVNHTNFQKTNRERNETT